MACFAMDLRAIALFRMVAGALILLDLWIRAQDIGVFYTADGVCPVRAMPHSHYTMKHLELYRQIDSVWGVGILFLVAAFFATTLILGIYSRSSAALSWYFLASIQNRNIYLNDGGDLYLRTLLLCAVFLPLGARWSWDARKRPEWSRLPNRYISLPSAAFVLQVCIMYFTAAVLKNHPVWRESGDALYMALSIDQFSTGFAQWLLQYPNFLRPLTFCVLAIEFLAPVLILFPLVNSLTRCLAILLLVGFHLGIASCMHLGLFMPICIAVLIGLLPTPVLDALTRRHSPGPDSASQPPSSLPSGYRTALPVKAFFVSVILFLVIQNAITVPALNLNPPDPVKYAVLGYGRSTALMQNWTLFAPYPFVDDGWFIMEATRQDGSQFDLMTGLAVSYYKPQLVSSQFPNQRWRRWYQNMWKRYNPKHVPHFLWWMARDWNRKHPDQSPVASVRLIFVEERTQLPGIRPTWRSYVLGEFPSDWLAETNL